MFDEAWKNLGATIMGWRMFEVGEGPWRDEPPFHMPVFVVTHNARDSIVKEGDTTLTFVTDSIEGALNHAKAAAGDKDVLIAGGANIIQQFINAGLLDELQIHLVPVQLGDGRRLFEQNITGYVVLESTRVIDSPDVTHLRFRVTT
jgi:dihydrofolate reductase